MTFYKGRTAGGATQFATCLLAGSNIVGLHVLPRGIEAVGLPHVIFVALWHEETIE